MKETTWAYSVQRKEQSFVSGAPRPEGSLYICIGKEAEMILFSLSL